MDSIEKVPEIGFKEITSENADVLAQLRLEINHDKAPEDLQAEAEMYASNPGMKAYISVEDSVPTGYIELLAEDNELHSDAPEINTENLAHIARIAVAEEHRNKGIGKALLAQAEQWAIEQGKEGVWLDYLADNEGARKLYESAGYKDVAEFVDTKKKQKQRRIAVKRFQ